MLNSAEHKFILLINVKMPTIVGILTFTSMIYTTSERRKTRNFFSCRYFSFYEQLKCSVELSMKKVLLPWARFSGDKTLKTGELRLSGNHTVTEYEMSREPYS